MALDFPNSPLNGQNYNGYVWDGEKWVINDGSAGGVIPSNNAPLGDGTAAPGLAIEYSRNDHVHPSPLTARGDIMFRSATGEARLSAGPLGHHLQTNGASGDPVWAGFLQSGTSAVARSWQDKGRDILSVKDFGAVGNGIVNDTAAIQAAINAAAPKNIVFFPAGKYLVVSTISITTGINLRGVGFQSIYKGAADGSVIITANAITVFGVTTDDAVTIEKLSFLQQNTTATFIRIDTDTSSDLDSNYGTLIRDCEFVNGSRAIHGISILDFHFDNCSFYNQFNISCQVDTLSIGNGDSVLTNCVFSGAPTGGHFQTGTLGGVRIVNNKFNCGGTFAIVIGQGGVVSGLSMSPLMIMNNSIEGIQYGILFQRTGAGTINCNNLQICDNEFAVSVTSGFGIASMASGGNTNPWIKGGVISGNFFGSVGNGINFISLDAAEDINITGNQFYSFAGTTANAIALGPKTARIGQHANAAGPNVTLSFASASVTALAANGMQINGAMDISQEHGNSAISLSASPISKYIIDGIKIGKTGTSVLTSQKVASVFPGYGSELKLTVTTAQASMGADALWLDIPIEGYRFACAGWGTSQAAPVTVGYWIKSSVGGTFTNRMTDITTVTVDKTVVVSAGVAQWVSVTFPVQATWTGSLTNALGALLRIILADGSLNTIGTVGNTFEITGLVILPGEVLLPAAQANLLMRPYEREIEFCERHYRKTNSGFGIAASATMARMAVTHPNMRIAPQVALSAPALITDIYASNPLQSAASAAVYVNDADAGQYDLANFTGLTVGRVYVFWPTTRIIFDARM